MKIIFIVFALNLITNISIICAKERWKYSNLILLAAPISGFFLDFEPMILAGMFLINLNLFQLFPLDEKKDTNKEWKILHVLLLTINSFLFLINNFFFLMSTIFSISYLMFAKNNFTSNKDGIYQTINYLFIFSLALMFSLHQNDNIVNILTMNFITIGFMVFNIIFYPKVLNLEEKKEKILYDFSFIYVLLSTGILNVKTNQLEQYLIISLIISISLVLKIYHLISKDLNFDYRLILSSICMIVLSLTGEVKDYLWYVLFIAPSFFTLFLKPLGDSDSTLKIKLFILLRLITTTLLLIPLSLLLQQKSLIGIDFVKTLMAFMLMTEFFVLNKNYFKTRIEFYGILRKGTHEYYSLEMIILYIFIGIYSSLVILKINSSFLILLEIALFVITAHLILFLVGIKLFNKQGIESFYKIKLALNQDIKKNTENDLYGGEANKEKIESKLLQVKVLGKKLMINIQFIAYLLYGILRISPKFCIKGGVDIKSVNYYFNILFIIFCCFSLYAIL